jgi:hypothetical protein
MIWAKPYFDKKKTWNFTSLKEISTSAKTENWLGLMNYYTQMKICRGSGVVEKSTESGK